LIFQHIQRFLENRAIAAGQTIEFGWLIFKIRALGPPLLLESLDFRAVASFTTDLTEAEKVHQLQIATLKANSTDGEPCTLRQYAVVSRSYIPGHPDAFLKRDTGVRGNDSGWYLGVRDDKLDFQDPICFSKESLYEISIKDIRAIAYWLLPVGSFVTLQNAKVELLPRQM
jgi:hypothetical protein